jgi:hypothetical protein
VLDNMTTSAKFLNVSVVEDGSTLWIFGSGTYRASDVYLAKVDAAQVADRSAWSYFSGYQQGTPVFTPSESGATPVVSAGCVGELSVRQYEDLGYLMTYNCANPRGIVLCFANQPAGPWSAGTLIFAPYGDLGYGYFMHQKESDVGYDDGLSDPGVEDSWGGEYGPYLIPQWMTVDSPGVFSIVGTLSSWNPYRSHLMHTIVAQPGVSASPPPPAGVGLPLAALVNANFDAGLTGWQASGDPFLASPGQLTTNAPPKGPGAEGAMWQDFTVDAKTHELHFALSGSYDPAASVELQLLQESDSSVVATVRASRGTGSDSQQRTVHWLLDDLHGKKVRLLIEDSSPTSYITTTGFTFVQDP